MKYELVVIGLSGFLGSISRYLVYVWVGSRNLTTFPWATLFVNISGCLVIGFLSSIIERQVPYHRQLFLMGSVGFLGSFTTFSAFGLETLNLLRSQHIGLAILNIFANVIIGIAMAGLGRGLGQLL